MGSTLLFGICHNVIRHDFIYVIETYSMMFNVLTAYPMTSFVMTLYVMTPYGKPEPGARFCYEFCCSFPQNAQTLHTLKYSIFVGILCRFLPLSDLALVETISSNLGQEGVPKHQTTLFRFGYD